MVVLFLFRKGKFFGVGVVLRIGWVVYVFLRLFSFCIVIQQVVVVYKEEVIYVVLGCLVYRVIELFFFVVIDRQDVYLLDVFVMKVLVFCCIYCICVFLKFYRFVLFLFCCVFIFV